MNMVGGNNNNNNKNNNNRFPNFYFLLLFCFLFFNFFSFNIRADEIVAIDKSSIEVSANAGSAEVVTALSQAPTTTKMLVPPVQKVSTTSQLANLLGGLGLILLLIFGLSWFVKRFSRGGFMQNSTIKMISAMPLGTRERLMLVDVGGKQMLLGVTATQINTLHVFDEPIINTSDNKSASHSVVSSDFSQKLMSILQNKNPNTSEASDSKK